MSNRLTFNDSPPAPNLGGSDLPGGTSNAARYAVLSSIASVITVLACGVTIGVHFVRDINLPEWWVGIAVLLTVALAVALLAQRCLPPIAAKRSNSLRAWVATAWLMFVAAGVVYAITFMPMSFLFYAKSAEGRAALREAREEHQDVLQARQIAENRQAAIDAAFQRELARLDQELRSVKRQMDQVAKDAERKESQTLLEEQKQAEKLLELQRANYQRAALETLLVADKQQPLPVAAQGVRWPGSSRSVGSEFQQLQSSPTPRPLVAEEQTADGLRIRRLALRGSDFIPKVGLFYTMDQSQRNQSARDQVNVALVSYSGEELEISLPAGALQRTTNLGTSCDDFSYSGATLYVVQKQANKVLLVRHTVEDTRFTRGDGANRQGRVSKIISPLRIAANNSTGDIQVITDTSTPLLAEMTQEKVTGIRELPTDFEQTSARFSLSQLGQDVYLTGEREIFVAQKDGIYQAQLTPHPATARVPAHRTERNGGFISLDGEQFIAFQHRWPVQSLAWQKVIPAAGIDVKLFANFGADLLATANAQSNLLVYDKQGKLHSRHTWPAAGKTLGIAGLRDRSEIVVFTERSIYLVSYGQGSRPSQKADLAKNSPRSPAISSRLNTIATNAVPMNPTSSMRDIAGESYEIPGAKVHALKLQQCKQWAWGDTADTLYALDYGDLYKVNTKTRTIERWLHLAEKDYSDFALTRTRSRLLVIMPQQKQLVACDLATLEPKTFGIDDFSAPKALLGLAAAPRVEWFALLSGKGSESRLEVVDPRDGKILWTITPGELNPPPTELGWFAIGPDDNSLVCMPRDRIYWIRLSGKTWQQSPVAAEFNTKYINATPLVWPATGCLYWGGGRSYNGFNLMKPGEPAPSIQPEASNTTIEFDPSGKFYWTNQIKKIDIATQKELASYPLQKAAYSFARSPNPNILRSGNLIVEITLP